MTTYIAWDGKEYPRPVPEDWYLASDGRWWPAGYGPGPTEGEVVDDGSVGAFVAPDPSFGGSDPSERGGEADSLDDLSGSSRLGDPPRSGGSAARRIIVGLVLVVLLAGAAAIAFRSTDNGTSSAPATTVFRTELTVDEDPAPVEEAETTTSTTEVVETVPPPPEKGSVEDPYEIGDEVRLEYTDSASGQDKVWTIEVLGPATERTRDVLAENQFNEAPPGDSVFVVLPVRVTYESGPAPASLFDLNFKAVGPLGVVLTTFDPSCGVVPDGLDSLTELFPGGTVEGNVCWVAKPADAEDLTMMIEVFLLEGETFVRLKE